MDDQPQSQLGYADLWRFVPERWQSELIGSRQTIESIGRKLDALVDQGVQILPSPERVFAALDVSPSAVRVIIIGQDPYPNPEHAIGLAFAVPANTSPLPPTLRNILQELSADLGESVAAEELLEWPSKGVLLMNSALTVSAGESGSHADMGWSQVVQAILQAVAVNSPNAVIVLWGKQAQRLVPIELFANRIESAHPSPLSSYRGFFGSNPFSHVNEMLAESGQSPINW